MLGNSWLHWWNNNVPLGGSPASLTVTMRIAEQIGFFTGLGIVIVAIASAAFGRIISLPAEVVAEEPAPTVPAETTEPVA